MQTHFSIDVVFSSLAAIVAIPFLLLLILKRPQFSSSRHRSLSFSSAQNLGVSSTMVLSQLLHSWNSVVVDGAAEDLATQSATTSKTTTTLSSIQEPTSVASKKADYTKTTNPIAVEGVELPGHRVVDGTHLIRNGHGMRSITYFGIGIRIYVAAMYSAEPILSADQAMGTTASEESHDTSRITMDASRQSSAPNTDDTIGPLQLDFTFLRYVRQSQVVSAWTQQINHSVTYRDYEGYQADKDRFISLASGGPIENHGTQSVQMVGDETRIIDQGKLAGVIHGRNFQRSFLSMWFGSMAVSEDLKSNLLKGDEHHPSDIQHVREKLQQQQQPLKQVLIEA